MKNLKNFKKFNEELNADVWSLYWEGHLLGTLGYLASFGVGYFIYKYFMGQSERASVENAKKTIDMINDSDEMRNVIIKVIQDDRIQNLLSQYKEKIENNTITFNEMKTLGEEMKTILGDILTPQEWHLSEFIIGRLSKSPSVKESQISKNYTEEEKEILHNYGFTEKSETEFVNESGIRIIKKTDNGGMFYEFRKDNEEFKKGSFTAIMFQNEEEISGYYKDLEKCIIGSTTDDELVDELKNMIKEHKTMFKRSRKKDIINFLSNFDTKEKMEKLILDYKEKFNIDLIDLFKSIDTNFGDSSHLEWMLPFINSGVVDREFNRNKL